MSAITIRRLDPAVKARLQARAKANGRSMEAEARAILAAAPEPAPSGIHAGLAAVKTIMHGADVPENWLSRNNDPTKALFE
ncbi:MAG: toxin-antitoxin system [Micrococcales bacterium]|nr:toxin-antitoxin system [Micrococcales bacterium]